MKRDKSEVNLHNSSRKQKSNRLDLVDSISPLPDSILGLILSLLPTKNVVSTSVLSKRWKFAWMTVHNLDFYHEGYEEELVEGEDIKFVKFVNRVLFLLDDGLLNKFHLVWKTNCISSHACSWIETAIRRNVHELFLCVGTPVVGLGPSDVPYPLQMPTSVFKCDSLKSLELRGDISISATTMVYLPKLESLKLVSVFFESEEAFERLISGCLILNYLHLFVDFLYREDYFEYIISSNSLRRLEVSFENYQCGLRIKASSLEYLEIKGYMYRLFVQKNLSSLVGVYLRIEMVDDDLSSNSIIEAVRAFDCAKSLNLSSDVMEGLCCAEFFSATKFTRLVKFEAQICGSCDYNSLQDLLEQSKCLEVLTIHQDISCLHGNDHAASNWSILVEVPICLVKCLKMVEIVGYHGLDSERAMISYILKHGSALEAMKITWDVFISKNAKLALVEEICKFPRKSPVCEVEFFKSHLRSLFPHLDDD